MDIVKKIRTSKCSKIPFVKKTLLFIWDSYWQLLRRSIKDDKKFISFLYRKRFNRELNWDSPQTFNEKLQWLKLYNHKPVYVTMADKFAVKKFVADIIGEEYVVPCLGVWERAEDIDFDKLPNQFVLKCNHNSGYGRCICKDKSLIDRNKVRKDLKKSLKQNYYLPGRDKQYRDIPRRIIADKFLDDGTGSELRDYKFWCFDGTPHFMYCTNKGEHIYENFYDMDFNPVSIDHGYPRIEPEIEKPEEFELMKELASKLSKGIPFVRVDFFDVNHHVYFGEFTFFDWGGLRPFGGDWDKELGKLIQLPK